MRPEEAAARSAEDGTGASGSVPAIEHDDTGALGSLPATEPDDTGECEGYIREISEEEYANEVGQIFIGSS